MKKLALLMLLGIQSALAANDLACLDQMKPCMDACIAKGDMTCFERCSSDSMVCLEREKQAKNPTQVPTTSSSNNSSTNLEGCWRSNEKLTTWCFSGSTAVITTDSYAGGAVSQRITHLDRLTLDGTAMSYYIVRAKMTGQDGYDNAVNKGPYNQPYTYSQTNPPAFYAAGDRYVKQ